MHIHSVGIDLGKTTFHVVALGDNGKVLLKKKFTQRQSPTQRAHRRGSQQAGTDRMGGAVEWPGLSGISRASCCVGKRNDQHQVLPPTSAPAK